MTDKTNDNDVQTILQTRRRRGRLRWMPWLLVLLVAGGAGA